MAYSFDEAELALLNALATDYVSADAALAEIAALRAMLSLPKGTIHVISDIHGEDKKLRHVINNASGSLRPLVQRLFADRLKESEQRQLLNILYYPREATSALQGQFADTNARRAWAKRTLRQQFEVVRSLASIIRRASVIELVPPVYLELFAELRNESTNAGAQYVDAMVDALADHDRDLDAIRAASRLVRNLSAAEIIVAGDLGDRGPHIDRVTDYLMRQPNISIVWGNHDVSWMGACLGQPALVATIVRISLRYGRMAQLEEGYGISLQPLRALAGKIYGDDSAEHFKVKNSDIPMLARMQKAIAILQFKLEGQTSRRHPEWEMGNRDLLHRIDRSAGTVEIEGKRYPLLDRHLPTIDPASPYELSVDEKTCIDQLSASFTSSSRLSRQHMSFVARRGSMWTRRDDALIFHACVPVDENGEPIPLEVEGKPRAGRALFDAIDSIIRRAFRKGSGKLDSDADWLWYLWAGPKSPLFGKDKMATFESHFVADKATYHEHKNPYFEFIHDAEFVKRIGREFGMGDDVLVVNGHVPVKIEKGEQPVKRGGNAVTIDGAFSEAYGDRGYTLILAPDGIKLAEHNHFESVEQVIETGADIIPKMTTIHSYTRPHAISDTEEGEGIRRQINALERLIFAYHEGAILERVASRR